MSWPCGQHPQPKPDSHRRRYSATRRGAKAILVATAGPVIYTGVANRLAAAPHHAGSPAGHPLRPPRESNEGRKVEDHDAHQTRRRSAQARRTQSRRRRPQAVAGNRCPTALECPPTASCRDQRKPLRSARPPLRLPHAATRLEASRKASEPRFLFPSQEHQYRAVAWIGSPRSGAIPGDSTRAQLIPCSMDELERDDGVGGAYRGHGDAGALQAFGRAPVIARRGCSGSVSVPPTDPVAMPALPLDL